MAQRLDKPDWIEEHEDQSRSFKRQKSERTILAETFDNVKLIGGGICDEIVNFGSDLISNVRILDRFVFYFCIRLWSI